MLKVGDLSKHEDTVTLNDPKRLKKGRTLRAGYSKSSAIFKEKEANLLRIYFRF